MMPFVYDLIYTVPLAFSAAMMIAENEPVFAAVAALIEIVCVLFVHLKTRGRAMIAGIACVLAVGTLLLYHDGSFETNLWILKLLAICIVIIAVHKLAGLDGRIKASLAVAGFAGLVVLMIKGVQVPKPAFACICFCIITAVAESVYKDHAVYFLPFAIAVITPLVFAWIPEKPYDWKFVKTVIEDIRYGIEAVSEMFSPDLGWDSSNAGFSEKGVMSGNVSSDPYRALTVSSSIPNDYRVYLAGKSFDTFSGREWTKADGSDSDYSSYDILETTAAIMRQNPDDIESYIHRGRMRIKYEGVRTKHAFTPAKSCELTVKNTRSGGDIILDRARGADYYVDFYRINRSAELVVKALCEKIPLDERSFELAKEALKNSISDNCTFEGYQKYRQEVYDRYLLPVELSSGTKEYLDGLLEGADSDYEKLCRIEEALGGYTYSTSPGSLPETVRSDADFLDYLLFEKKEGYCTHFATAFVLLARAEGIPARYVQGYSVLSRINDYEVLSDRAHAWPEAYIDGVGWTGFEPTPGFIQPAGWAVTDGNPVKSSEGSFHTVYDEKQKEDSNDEVKEDPAKDDRAAGEWVRIMLISVAAFLTVFAIVDRIIRLIRYKRMDNRDRMIDICRRCIRILRFTGAKILPGETLREYRSRISTRIPPDLLDFLDDYEHLLYSAGSVSPGRISELEQCKKALIKHILKCVKRDSPF